MNPLTVKTALSADLLGRVLASAARRGVAPARIQRFTGKAQNWMHGQLGHHRALAQPGRTPPQWLQDSLLRFRNPGGRRGALDRAFAADDALDSYSALSRLESQLPLPPPLPRQMQRPRMRPQLTAMGLGSLGLGVGVASQDKAASWTQRMQQYRRAL